jgi:hypothetical protein
VRRAQELCLAHGTDDRLVPLDAAAATATGSRKMQMGIVLSASTRTLGVNRCAALFAICRHTETTTRSGARDREAMPEMLREDDAGYGNHRLYFGGRPRPLGLDPCSPGFTRLSLIHCSM